MSNPRFDNPWKDSKGFVCLGRYQRYEGTKGNPVKYDLYALVSQGIKSKAPDTALWSVDLGARYSDEGSEYISGSLDTGWKYGDEKPMAECARRYVQFLMKNQSKTTGETK